MPLAERSTCFSPPNPLFYPPTSTASELLSAWHSREVSRLLEKEKLADQEGIFIDDASYAFVPDNPRLEGSSVLLFDEDDRPVKLTIKKK